jgi:hypothetical protein
MWKAVFERLEGAQFAEDKVVVDAELRRQPNAGVPGGVWNGLYWSVRII